MAGPLGHNKDLPIPRKVSNFWVDITGFQILSDKGTLLAVPFLSASCDNKLQYSAYLSRETGILVTL